MENNVFGTGAIHFAEIRTCTVCTRLSKGSGGAKVGPAGTCPGCKCKDLCPGCAPAVGWSLGGETAAELTAKKSDWYKLIFNI